MGFKEKLIYVRSMIYLTQTELSKNKYFFKQLSTNMKLGIKPLKSRNGTCFFQKWNCVACQIKKQGEECGYELFEYKKRQFNSGFAR